MILNLKIDIYNVQHVCVLWPGRGGVARLRAAVRHAEPGRARARVQRDRRAALRRAPRLGRGARRGRRHGGDTYTLLAY